MREGEGRWGVRREGGIEGGRRGGEKEEVAKRVEGEEGRCGEGERGGGGEMRGEGGGDKDVKEEVAEMYRGRREKGGCGAQRRETTRMMEEG